MRLGPVACAVFGFWLVACEKPDQSAPDPASESTPEAASAASRSEAAADPAADSRAVLAALGLTPDADGKIVNECGDVVLPTIVPADLGGAVGTAQLVAIEGGERAPACYGDGPDLHLLRRDGAGWREIYRARGRMLIVLPSSTGGVRDLADGGPGFSFPVWTWNGSAYAPAGREIADGDLGDATFLP
jgi:hypothetical protein